MKKMILLFSHQLTESQKNDAKKNWEVENFVALPPEIQHIWTNIDPELESLKDVLAPISLFIENEVGLGDIVLIQGDFGACYMMVRKTEDLGAIPVYATTKRMVEEFVEEGKQVKKSIFEHRRFRRYE